MEIFKIKISDEVGVFGNFKVFPRAIVALIFVSHFFRDSSIFGLERYHRLIAKGNDQSGEVFLHTKIFSPGFVFEVALLIFFRDGLFGGALLDNGFLKFPVLFLFLKIQVR